LLVFGDIRNESRSAPRSRRLSSAFATSMCASTAINLSDTEALQIKRYD
jgi:hypothetical protein